MTPPRLPDVEQQHAAPAQQAISPCTCFKIRSLARQVSQLYDDMLAPSGLRRTQYSLIAHPRRPRGRNAPTVSELAAAIFTDRTTRATTLLVREPFLRQSYIRPTRVKLAPGSAASEALARELMEHCRERLAHFKCPRGVDFDPALPRSEAGKVQRRVIRERYWQGLGRQI